MQNCFLMLSRLKIHIVLVLDRLQCVARVNCLVYIISSSYFEFNDSMFVVSILKQFDGFWPT